MIRVLDYRQITKLALLFSRYTTVLLLDCSSNLLCNEVYTSLVKHKV